MPKCLLLQGYFWEHFLEAIFFLVNHYQVLPYLMIESEISTIFTLFKYFLTIPILPFEINNFF